MFCTNQLIVNPNYYDKAVTVAPVAVTTPADLVALFAPGGAGDAAIVTSINAAFGVAFAANGPVTLAIGATIGAAVNNHMAAVTARMDNMRFQTRNNSIFNASTAIGSAACILTPILKVIIKPLVFINILINI